jgi:hypothetical protein
MSGEYTQVGEITLNDQAIGFYVAPDSLPDEPAKREVCEAHLCTGADAQMLSDFWMSGCHFPEEGAPDQNVYAQFSCKGLSRFTKRCRLTLTQVDAEGNQLTKGQFK